MKDTLLHAFLFVASPLGCALYWLYSYFIKKRTFPVVVPGPSETQLKVEKALDERSKKLDEAHAKAEALLLDERTAAVVAEEKRLQVESDKLLKDDKLLNEHLLNVGKNIRGIN